MDLYGRPVPRHTTRSPTVAFLNERPKSLSFSGFNKVLRANRGSSEDEIPHLSLPGRSSNQQQQQHNQQQPSFLHQRPASSRFLNRPQSSSGVRRPEPFAVSHEGKQRPRTARDGTRTLPNTIPKILKRSCFTQDIEPTAGPESDRQENEEGITDIPSSLDEQYLQQLKADILHLHNAHRQLEKEAIETEGNANRSTVTSSSAPNHVKNLLLHRDTKAYLGWSSQRNMDFNQDLGTPSTASIQTQLLIYNYSSDPTQLAAAKVGLEGLLAETLVSLMKFCLARNENASESTESGSTNVCKVKLVRPPAEQRGNTPILQFANGCGTSPASIYAGGMLSVLEQTEVMKRSMLASTGEKKVLAKMLAEKDAKLLQLNEQMGFFKDALAQSRPHVERSQRVDVHYKEREHEITQDPVDADQAQSTLSTEQLARLAALEKDRVESILSIQNLEQQRNELEQQLENATIELQSAFQRLEITEKQHQETLSATEKSLHDQVKAMEKHAADLQGSLALTIERYHSLEQAASQEKTQLRRDKQELERLIRLKEDEVSQRQAKATAKAEAEAQSAQTQLNLVTKQLNQAQQVLDTFRLDLKAAQTDNKQVQGTIRDLHHDLKVRNEDVERLSSKLTASNTNAENKTRLLQQTEARIEASSKEIERQQTLLEDQAHQIHELEAKLSRSVPVDDEELQNRQQREESAWHQRVSALEHALVAERQQTALFREQQRKALLMEQEKATHAVEQAQAVAAELATANLCLLERKRQREQEQKAFEEKLTEYGDRIADLSSDKGSLERELGTLRTQYQQLQQLKEKSENESAVNEKTLQEEVVAVKEELKNLTEIRENLDRELANALATPRGKSARHHANISELRVELQKAKQKIAALEEQLSHNGSIRTSEIDGKLAQLSARERRVAEEQRGLKKQRVTASAERAQLEKERAELDQQRESVECRQKTHHTLLQQVIVLLAQRLQVMMALFDTELTTAPNAVAKPASEDIESWREMQQQWESLRQELQNIDWKLEEMCRQLEALYLEYIGTSLVPVGEGHSSRSLLSGFHGPNPFSDAVAAGRDTVPVAEQLKANRLLRRLLCHDESLENRVCQVKAEDHETFALALAREMAAMKGGYERQLEDLRGELRKTQQRRQLTSQRLRAELANERSRSQQTIAQLRERISELEAALRDQDKAWIAAHTQQQAILDQYEAATSDGERQRALQELAKLVGSEQRRRERERLSKLLAYCGASSVTVEHRDRALEEETVDAVLAALEVDVEE
ncbi:hypothetical protein L916_17058 [Phytophthora nicotianae]|uniref:Uncharacterized protein n=1 Tax=Phytophthora nicotianae TaxID=4792 RepID=W2I8X5_PHYNI|nr:hypothetical protein L916_17058 [Phytophthora nicotianae]